MSPKSNKILEPVDSEIKNESQKVRTSVVGKSIGKVLGGSYISEGTFKFFRYLLFLAFLAFIYIANNYYAENNVREINQLRK